MSDPERQVITAIVDEDQLSLAIGRNGQNVRLASQLIGWQIDLYGSREWLELGADLSLFKREAEDDGYETSDFALAELELTPETLSALQSAGYSTFLQIIDFDRAAFLAMEGFGEPEADQLLALIDELTVVAGDADEAEEVVESADETDEVVASTEAGEEDPGDVEIEAEAAIAKEPEKQPEEQAAEEVEEDAREEEAEEEAAEEADEAEEEAESADENEANG
jgi:N utilization substance protein A